MCTDTSLVDRSWTVTELLRVLVEAKKPNNSHDAELYQQWLHRASTSSSKTGKAEQTKT